MSELDDLRKKDLPALQEVLSELYKHQFGLRMQKGNGQLSQSHTLRNGRREIARVKTLIVEKKKTGESS